jgi:hypothetical protein
MDNNFSVELFCSACGVKRTELRRVGANRPYRTNGFSQSVGNISGKNTGLRQAIEATYEKPYRE